MTRFNIAKRHQKPDPAGPVSHFQRIIATIPWLSTSPRLSTDPAPLSRGRSVLKPRKARQGKASWEVLVP
ncbi:MAG: hypothetical protein HY420_02050 [Candidatus Kerfeldbacteria bacterium]|nr:hypothetical protein [Candidatus Kerfeldbacteria bacterium]